MGLSKSGCSPAFLEFSKARGFLLPAPEKEGIMAKFTFILGGIRSGKSAYAVKLACSLKGKVAYIATCINPDAEMKKRIKLHKAKRPRDWKVIEEGKNPGSILTKSKNQYDAVLIDCLGLAVSNLLAEGLEDSEILASIQDLAQSISRTKITTILVSNEVGSSLIPDNLLGRRFCDLLGFANQIMAKQADEVILMQSGIPMTIKGKKDAKTKGNNK